MRILVISLPDLQKIPVQRYHYLLNYLAKNHEVTVISVNAWWLEERDDSKAMLKDVDYHYITNKKVHPIVQEMLIFKYFSYIKKKKFDIILNLNTLLAALLVKCCLGTPMIFDIADDLVDGILNSPIFPKFLKNKISEKIIAMLLTLNLQRSNLITIVTQNLKREYNIPEAKILHNGVNLENYKGLHTPHRRDKKSLFLGFIGVLGEWVDLDPILNAIFYFLKSKSIPIHFLIIGDGPIRERYIKFLDKLNLSDTVKFIGFVEHGKIPYYLKNIDVGIVPFSKKSKIAIHSFPIKILEYLAGKKAVISSELPAIRFNLGKVIFFAEDYKDYIDILVYLFENPKELRKKGILGYRIIERSYTWNVIARKFDDYLQEILRGVD